VVAEEPPKKIIIVKDFAKLSQTQYVDFDAERNKAHKMYQYTLNEKKKLCVDDEDFENFITQKFKSLKKRSDVNEKINEFRPYYKRKQEAILYPKTSQLEHVISLAQDIKEPESEAPSEKSPVVKGNYFLK
jgi:hypothetical protein